MSNEIVNENENENENENDIINNQGLVLDEKENLTWVEKYRPVDFDSIVGNEVAINQFKTISKNGNIPHMILAGSPGTGKTTSVICLSKILLGDEFRNAFLELNASDERGIDIIRSKITTFCKKKVNLPEGIHKIIFLDEFDSMTPIAQQALRRIIELYSTTTRFVMACNSSTKIIEAIQSRCSIIRFSKIGIEDMKNRLIQICEMEGIEYDDDGLKILLSTTDGDMRKSINNLQSIALIYGNVSIDNVNRTIDRPNYNIVENMFDLCLNKNFDEIHNIIKKLIEDGYSAMDIINLLFIIIKNREEIDVVKRINILSKLGDTQMNLIHGGDSYIQLLSLAAKICM